MPGRAPDSDANCYICAFICTYFILPIIFFIWICVEESKARNQLLANITSSNFSSNVSMDTSTTAPNNESILS